MLLISLSPHSRHPGLSPRAELPVPGTHTTETPPRSEGQDEPLLERGRSSAGTLSPESLKLPEASSSSAPAGMYLVSSVLSPLGSGLGVKLRLEEGRFSPTLPVILPPTLLRGRPRPNPALDLVDCMGGSWLSGQPWSVLIHARTSRPALGRVRAHLCLRLLRAYLVP